MSYEKAVGWLWSELEASTDINELLARSVIDNQESRPAIYDTNAPQEPLFPYLLIRVDPTRGGVHWAQMAAQVTFDVFDDSGSSILTNQMKESIESALSFNRILSQDNLYLCYPNDDGMSVPEEDPRISHITFTMQLKYWRNDLIAAVN